MIGQTGCTPISYWDKTAFQTPTNVSTTSTAQYLLGNAARSQPLKLRSPNTWNWDAGMRKTFPIHKDLVFQFEANVTNVWNHVTFGGPAGAWSTSSSTTFGQITGVQSSPLPRDWQFAGHIKF